MTYSDENLPADGSLNPDHSRDWLKRVRYYMGDRPVRYYLNGEYGDETFRPHYHAVLFGVSTLDTAPMEAWKLGLTHVGELTLQSAQYITGYVTKKMVKHDDPRLGGRHPEYARMSRRPGLGAETMADIANALSDVHGARLVAAAGDVPVSLLHGGRSLPLGRYLRSKLREEMGFESFGGQEKPEMERHAEMQALLEAAGSRQAYLENKPFIDRVKIRQVETKARIWRKKASL